MNDIKEISDTLQAADTYLKHLQSIKGEIQDALAQISITSSETEGAIDKVFDDLINNVVKTLKLRRQKLKDKVLKTKEQSLEPLEACRLDVQKKIDSTCNLINEGQSYLLKGAVNGLDEFSQKSSLLGSLPVVPELKEVPFLTFQLQPNQASELLEICANFGEVSQIAPVQISQTSEKPGAILVEWQSVENDERLTDIQEFRLQRAYGDVIKNQHLLANFSDCYRGLDSQFLVKDLRPNQIYSFRVCCKFEGVTTWSPWSLPQTAATNLKPFSWRTSPNYNLANDNKIAYPKVKTDAILLSDGPQFNVGYCVEFTYLEFDGTPSVIGLITLPETIPVINSIKSDENNYFVFESNGEIYVDGVKKSTKLPEIHKGMKISFTCELVGEDKVRVNVDCNDKRVTYDWHINKNDKIYFVAQLASPNNKLMVE